MCETKHYSLPWGSAGLEAAARPPARPGQRGSGEGYAAPRGPRLRNSPASTHSTQKQLVGPKPLTTVCPWPVLKGKSMSPMNRCSSYGAGAALLLLAQGRGTPARGDDGVGLETQMLQNTFMLVREPGVSSAEGEQLSTGTAASAMWSTQPPLQRAASSRRATGFCYLLPLW